jgi:hypothetical protein
VAPGEAAPGTSAVPAAGLSAFEKAAAGLIEAGLAFIESIAVRAGNSQSAHHGDTQHPLSVLFSRDNAMPQQAACATLMPMPNASWRRLVSQELHAVQNATETLKEFVPAGRAGRLSPSTPEACVEAARLAPASCGRRPDLPSSSSIQHICWHRKTVY